MKRVPVDTRPSTWLDYSSLEPRPLPERDDRWEEQITPGEVAGMVVAAIVFFPLFLAGLAFWIVALTPAAK